MRIFSLNGVAIALLPQLADLKVGPTNVKRCTPNGYVRPCTFATTSWLTDAGAGS
jgi:hypothetical protein